MGLGEGLRIRHCTNNLCNTQPQFEISYSKKTKAQAPNVTIFSCTIQIIPYLNDNMIIIYIFLSQEKLITSLCLYVEERSLITIVPVILLHVLQRRVQESVVFESEGL